jgi:hypothetical protein
MSPVSAMVMKTIRISRVFAKIAPKRGRKKSQNTTILNWSIRLEISIANIVGFMKLWIMNFYFLKGSVEILQ